MSIDPNRELAMRVFIGMKVSEKDLEQLYSCMQGDLVKKRHHPDDLHMTLCFLGELSDQQVETLKSELEQLSGVARFTWIADKLGPFPDRNSPKVFAVEGATTPELERLRRQLLLLPNVRSLMAEYSQPFRPHISVSRDRKAVKSIEIDLVTIEFKSFGLYLSQSNPSSGPRYKAIKEWYLE